MNLSKFCVLYGFKSIWFHIEHYNFKTSQDVGLNPFFEILELHWASAPDHAFTNLLAIEDGETDDGYASGPDFPESVPDTGLEALAGSEPEPSAGSELVAHEPSAGSELVAHEPLAASELVAPEPSTGAEIAAPEPSTGSEIAAQLSTGSVIAAQEPSEGDLQDSAIETLLEPLAAPHEMDAENAVADTLVVRSPSSPAMAIDVDVATPPPGSKPAAGLDGVAMDVPSGTSSLAEPREALPKEHRFDERDENSKGLAHLHELRARLAMRKEMIKWAR